MSETKKITIWRMLSLFGLLLSIVVAVVGIRKGIFTSQEMMQKTVKNFGVAGPVIFILLQIVQVVFPILPGGISCLAGVLLFGAVRGFLYNYIGICLGSFLAFALSKNFGRPLLVRLFNQKLIEKYDGWTVQENHFEKLFSLAIFLPVAPDDFLCYLAGTTTMSWKKYVAIILLGKPFAILAYSLFLNTVANGLIRWM